jgi:hypothetical protein
VLLVPARRRLGDDLHEGQPQVPGHCPRRPLEEVVHVVGARRAPGDVGEDGVRRGPLSEEAAVHGGDQAGGEGAGRHGHAHGREEPGRLTGLVADRLRREGDDGRVGAEDSSGERHVDQRAVEDDLDVEQPGPDDGHAGEQGDRRLGGRLCGDPQGVGPGQDGVEGTDGGGDDDDDDGEEQPGQPPPLLAVPGPPPRHERGQARHGHEPEGEQHGRLERGRDGDSGARAHADPRGPGDRPPPRARQPAVREQQDRDGRDQGPHDAVGHEGRPLHDVRGRTAAFGQQLGGRRQAQGEGERDPHREVHPAESVVGVAGHDDGPHDRVGEQGGDPQEVDGGHGLGGGGQDLDGEQGGDQDRTGRRHGQAGATGTRGRRGRLGRGGRRHSTSP